MTKLPQVLRNVAVDAPMPDVADRLADEIDRVGADLGDQAGSCCGRRAPSPSCGSWAEAATEEAAAAAVDRLVAAVEALRTRPDRSLGPDRCWGSGDRLGAEIGDPLP